LSSSPVRLKVAVPVRNAHSTLAVSGLAQNPAVIIRSVQACVCVFTWSSWITLMHTAVEQIPKLSHTHTHTHTHAHTHTHTARAQSRLLQGGWVWIERKKERGGERETRGGKVIAVHLGQS